MSDNNEKKAVVEQVTHSDAASIRSQLSTASQTNLVLTPLEAAKAYPLAIVWSVLVSSTVILVGFGTILVVNFYAYPAFAKKYGQFKDSDGDDQLSDDWQSILGSCTEIGAFFGVVLNGYLVDMLGQKKVLIGALVAQAGFTFITFYAPNVLTLTIGLFLCGLPSGIFSTSAPAYASEVPPPSLRPYLTSYNNICFNIGHLLAAIVMECLVDRNDEWSYRIPFAIQWLWPAVLIPVLCFAPESPWHLVRKGKLDEAEASLRRLQRKSANIDNKLVVKRMVDRNEMEKTLTKGTTYWDCFRKSERHHTEVACMSMAAQVFSGCVFAYNSTYFFQQVGLSVDMTYELNVGGNAIAILGTVTNWIAITPFFGRRPTYLWGLVSMTMILLTIGVLSVWATGNDTIGMTQAVLTIVWTFVFQLSAGQLGWIIPAEVGSTRLRQKTICLARNSYFIASIAAQVLQPHMMNPGGWDMKGYTGFFWGGVCLLAFVWALFRLPETRYRAADELSGKAAASDPALV